MADGLFDALIDGGAGGIGEDLESGDAVPGLELMTSPVRQEIDFIREGQGIALPHQQQAFEEARATEALRQQAAGQVAAGGQQAFDTLGQFGDRQLEALISGFGQAESDLLGGFQPTPETLGADPGFQFRQSQAAAGQIPGLDAETAAALGDFRGGVARQELGLAQQANMQRQSQLANLALRGGQAQQGQLGQLGQQLAALQQARGQQLGAGTQGLAEFLTNVPLQTSGMINQAALGQQMPNFFAPGQIAQQAGAARSGFLGNLAGLGLAVGLR